MTSRKDSCQGADSLSKYEILDRLWQEWNDITGEENKALKMSKSNQLFLAMMDLFPWAADVMRVFYLNDMPLYNPQRQSFSKFARTRLNLRLKDIQRKEMGYRRTAKGSHSEGDESAVPKRIVPLSIDADDDNGGGKDVEDLSATGFLSEMDAADLMIELMTAMQRLDRLLHGQGNNAVRKRYFRMFYTDTVAFYVRHIDGCHRIIRHERDVFEEMYLQFLDFVTCQQCRTVNELYHVMLKEYRELVEGHADDQCVEFPLQDDVFVSYLLRCDGYTATPAAVSQQRKHYRELVSSRISENL